MDYFDQNTYLRNIFDIRTSRIELKEFNSVICNEKFYSRTNEENKIDFSNGYNESALEKKYSLKKMIYKLKRIIISIISLLKVIQISEQKT
ncbi:MAG: hypothetical protein H6613_16265 [Ignavibacteriales bacterium]|nr:hypothetical protein [Ignavibacteriales bacterium]